MVRSKQRSRDKPSPFKFQKGERVLVYKNSMIYDGKVQDQQVMIYNHNKNKYLIRFYEEFPNPSTKYSELWMWEELVLKYDDAGLAKKEELQRQANLAGGSKNSPSAGPSVSNMNLTQSSFGFKESSKRPCDDLASTPNVKRMCESQSSNSEDANSSITPYVTLEEDPTVEEWANYGRDFGKKVGKLDEDTHREIRYQMESILYNATKKK